MLLRRLIYFLIFIFLIWLALATRHHPAWFLPLISTYGGDTIWAGAFLFLLRVIFIETPLWKLAIVCYILGVLDEISQLYHSGWSDAIRRTTIGRLMFGLGFLWSDILCYAIGTILAFLFIAGIERFIFSSKKAGMIV